MWHMPILESPFLSVELIMKSERLASMPQSLDNSQAGAPRRVVPDKKMTCALSWWAIQTGLA
jgi:hypothetical protein